VTDVDLSPLEIASGVIAGADPGAVAVPGRSQMHPRRALESSFVRSLQRAPCCVSFSGGRDSSAVLATATHVARREGLPDPIPVTLRYPSVPEADESAWQEMVVAHLGLRDWHRIEIHHELDLLGPIALDLLKRHGLLWPSNVHTQVPVARVARGGTILTGLEGDGLFGAWRWQTLGAVLARRQKARPSDLARLAYANGPSVLRRARMGRMDPLVTPWLTPAANRVAARQWLRHEAEEPARWRARVRWWARRRYLAVARRSLVRVGSEFNTAFHHPLLDPQFLSAVANEAPMTGIGDRTEIMSRLFGDLLPKPILERSGKAWFRAAFWGKETQRFTREWDGRSVDTTLVDVEGLKRTWNDPEPDTRTATLLQSIWLVDLNRSTSGSD
jgi:asparagine synthase (glutamine-hydrolysing)